MKKNVLDCLAEARNKALWEYMQEWSGTIHRSDFCAGFEGGAAWAQNLQSQFIPCQDGMDGFVKKLKAESFRARAKNYMEEAMIRLDERNEATDTENANAAAFCALEAVIRAVNELVQE